MSTSSVYSSVLSLYSSSSAEEQIKEIPPSYSHPIQYLNPYANSLWVETHGEPGNETIKVINGQVKKNKLKFTDHTESPEEFEFPEREYTTKSLKSFPPRTQSLKNPLQGLLDGEESLLNQLQVVQVYRQQLRTKYAHTLTSKQVLLIFGNIGALIDLTVLFLKLLPNGLDSFYEHLAKLPYVAYPNLGELERCKNPSVWKWLEECEFHTNMRLSKALESPKHRLNEYLHFVDAMLISCDDYEEVERLYDAKTSLEKLIDSLSMERTHEMIRDDTQECQHLISQFKSHYSQLEKLLNSFNAMGEPLLKFIQYQKRLTSKWENFMEYEDELDECFIKSIYHCYYTKLCEQELLTQQMVNEVNERLIKAIQLALENCGGTTALIKRYKYSQAHKLKNELMDEIPKILKVLSQFQHYISLSYMTHIERWYASLCGSKKLENMGDNFDIIEMFVRSRYGTKQAMEEFEGIPTSRVVRRLFGV
jgi:hypothetical protein